MWRESTIKEKGPVAIFAVPNLWQPLRSPRTASKPRRWLRRQQRPACTHRKRDATRDNMTHRYRRRYFCRWRGARSLHTHTRINTMRRRHYAGFSVSIRSPPPPPSSRSPLVPAPGRPMANVIYYFIFFYSHSFSPTAYPTLLRDFHYRRRAVSTEGSFCTNCKPALAEIRSRTTIVCFTSRRRTYRQSYVISKPYICIACCHHSFSSRL